MVKLNVEINQWVIKGFDGKRKRKRRNKEKKKKKERLGRKE